MMLKAKKVMTGILAISFWSIIPIAQNVVDASVIPVTKSKTSQVATTQNTTTDDYKARVARARAYHPTNLSIAKSIQPTRTSKTNYSKTVASKYSKPVTNNKKKYSKPVSNSRVYKNHEQTKVTTKSVAIPKTAIHKDSAPTTIDHSSQYNSAQPYIRVLLGSRTSPLTVTSVDGISVYNSKRQKWNSYPAGTTFTVKASGNNVFVNGKAVDSVAYFQSSKGREESMMNTLGKIYRGDIKVSAVGSGMSIVNEVPLEQYLYGVVPEEAVPSWPIAALQAQAVAARTYALYNMETNKAKAYDVQPNTNNQVYQGKNAEFALTNKAVDSTKGMVMTFAGSPINAMFHSDGGGYTEDSVNVWGKSLPYLRGVKDYASNASTSQWQTSMTRSDMENKLSAAGKGVGRLKSIILSPLGKRPISAPDRGVSGRVKTATFVGSGGQVTVSGESLMSIFGLRSTLFDFSIDHKPVLDIDRSAVQAHHIFGGGNQLVYISGFGWGHGLGMSQWGAAAMAANANPNDLNYYKNILNHYYTNIRIEKYY